MSKLFNECKTCKKCCHAKGSDIVIPLTFKEQASFGTKEITIKKDTVCQYFGTFGCTLNDKKPLVCQMFPLIYKDDDFGVFEGCPLAKKFQDTMTLGTDQANHYVNCVGKVGILSGRDKKRISKFYQEKNGNNQKRS